MRGSTVLGVLAGLVMTSAAHATISFGVTGLAGSGVTADVSFTYTAANATSGTITVFIENTAASGRISGFAFNAPTIAGASLATIAGSDPTPPGDDVQALTSAIPEGSAVNEAGWYGLFEYEGIKTPNAAGDFDFGTMNADNPSSFITDGVGSGPRILNADNAHDSTTFTFAVTGTGLNLITEADWMAALSTNLPSGGPGYNFGVRFQGIDGSIGSDLATTTTTTSEVPLPPAALLGVIGLGTAGLFRRRR